MQAIFKLKKQRRSLEGMLKHDLRIGMNPLESPYHIDSSLTAQNWVFISKEGLNDSNLVNLFYELSCTVINNDNEIKKIEEYFQQGLSSLLQQEKIFFEQIKTKLKQSNFLKNTGKRNYKLLYSFDKFIQKYGLLAEGLIGFDHEFTLFLKEHNISPKVLDIAISEFFSEFSQKHNARVFYIVRHSDESATHYHFALFNLKNDGEIITSLIDKRKLKKLTEDRILLNQKIEEVIKNVAQVENIKLEPSIGTGVKRKEKTPAQLRATMEREIREFIENYKQKKMKEIEEEIRKQMKDSYDTIGLLTEEIERLKKIKKENLDTLKLKIKKTVLDELKHFPFYIEQIFRKLSQENQKKSFSIEEVLFVINELLGTITEDKFLEKVENLLKETKG